MTADDQYLESTVYRLLAEDDRIAEPGIRVVGHRDRLTLCGEVETQERREQIERLVAETFPGVHVCNEIGVTRMYEPDGAEELERSRHLE